MSHKDVFNRFQKLFPQYRDSVELYFPNGVDSIRVRREFGPDIAFTILGKNDWRLETVSRTVGTSKKTMRGGKMKGV